MGQLVPIQLYDINVDQPASELPNSIFSNGSNIQFDDGYIHKYKGYSTTYTPSVAPLHVMNVLTSTSSYWIYAGINKIYVDDGVGPGNPWDLTSVYSIATTVNERWTSTYFNGLPILNPKIADPVYWDLNTANDVQALPGWVTNDRADVIRSWKSYLFALNIENGGTRNANLMKWSSRASAGALPSTWTPAATNAAGQKEFSETDDVLIDAVPLKDLLIVYKQKSCYTVQEIGGQYIFRFGNLFGDFGALAVNCVVQFEKKHAVLSIDDFIVHDGNTWDSVIDDRMRKFLFKSINADAIDTCFLAHKKSDNEILICYPDSSSSIPNKAIAWNYRENTWMPDIPIPECYQMGIGVYSPTVDNTWDSDPQVWDADTTIWNEQLYQSVATTLIAAGYTDTQLYKFDTDSYTANGTYYNSFIERVSLPIDEGRMKFVDELWPDIRAVDGTEFDISVGFQDRPKDAINWHTQTFIVGTDEKIDVDHKGRFISIKISDKNSTQWKMGKKFQLNMSDAGKY